MSVKKLSNPRSQCLDIDALYVMPAIWLIASCFRYHLHTSYYILLFVFDNQSVTLFDIMSAIPLFRRTISYWRDYYPLYSYTCSLSPLVVVILMIQIYHCLVSLILHDSFRPHEFICFLLDSYSCCHWSEHPSILCSSYSHIFNFIFLYLHIKFIALYYTVLL